MMLWTGNRIENKWVLTTIFVFMVLNFTPTGPGGIQ